MGRQLYVVMDEILDAIDSGGDESPRFFLDLQSGQIELWVDPLLTGEEPEFDPDDRDRYAEIPRATSRDGYRAMEDFIAGLDEVDVQTELRRAIAGKGAFRRFRELLSGYPDLQARWEAEKRQRLLTEALAWFEELGIEPQYEMRPIAAPTPAGRPTSEPGRPQVGLFDLLLLGGKSELIEGRVRRVFTARNPEQARKVFARVARELTEHHGLAWRKRLVEGRDSFEIERCHLAVVGRMVELAVEVQRPVWDAFANPGPGSDD
jgi:hypothetical protein